VQDGVYDTFTKRLAETAGAMKVADGFEPGAVIGPLIGGREGRGAHRRRGQEGRQDCHRRQARRPGGSFFEPTVLTDVTTDMIITKEETFGPVAPLYCFKS
jgi:succinate-semialdehyde dehydrogenase/glutarate-semialdehyde dehydrogenase